MTENQKAYVRFMNLMILTLIISVSIMVLCSTYGEPNIIEYSPIHPK